MLPQKFPPLPLPSCLLQVAVGCSQAVQEFLSWTQVETPSEQPAGENVFTKHVDL